MGKEVNARLRDLTEGQVVIGAVDGVGESTSVFGGCFFRLQEQEFLCFFLLRLEVFIASGNDISRFLTLFVEVFAAFLRGGLEEIRAGIEVKAGAHEVSADGMVGGARCLLGIEGSRSGVVHADAGADADGGAVGSSLSGNAL